MMLCDQFTVCEFCVALHSQQLLAISYTMTADESIHFIWSFHCGLYPQESPDFGPSFLGEGERG